MGYFSEIIADSRRRVDPSRESVPAAVEIPSMEPQVVEAPPVAGASNRPKERPAGSLLPAAPEPLQVATSHDPASVTTRPADMALPERRERVTERPKPPPLPGQASAPNLEPVLALQNERVLSQPAVKEMATEQADGRESSPAPRAQPPVDGAADSKRPTSGEPLTSSKREADIAPFAALPLEQSQSLLSASEEASEESTNPAPVDEVIAQEVPPPGNLVAQDVRVRRADGLSSTAGEKRRSGEVSAPPDRAASTSVPRLQIGVVNVIIEGAAEPAKPAASVGDRNSASRNFLRSL
jgi:hypothetical protein